MNHEAASGKLLELAYGELTAREARAVEAHAAACDVCRGELAAIRETRALMAQLPIEPPPERGMGVVLAAAREAAAGRARRKPLLPPWLWAVAVAAVAVVSWQLAKTTPGGPTAGRESELLGRGSSTEIAPSPPPGERASAREQAAPAAPIAAAPPRPRPRVADRAKAPSAKREEATERNAASEGAAMGAAGVSAGAVAGGGAKWDRAEPAPAPSATSPSPPPGERAGVRGQAVPSAPASEAPLEAPAPAQKARSAFAPERKAVAPAAAAPEAEPVSGPGSVESRSFPDCPGERRRVVERDGDGRVIRYVRVGDRRTVEERYGADGRLRSAFAIEGGLRRALPAGAPGLVGDARDAGIDAPPRCSAP
jgi:hypothetical protein